MVNVAVTIQDGDLLALLQRIEQQFSPAGRADIYRQWGEEIRDVFFIPYPAQSNAPLQERYRWGDDSGLHKFKSIHHQRGFFAATHGGDDLPYDRTLETQRSVIWELTVKDGQAELTVEVPLQQDRGKVVDPKWWLGEEDEQSDYFRTLTNWIPLRLTLEAQQERFETIGAVVLENILERIAG